MLVDSSQIAKYQFLSQSFLIFLVFVLNVINNRNYVKLKLFPSDFIEGTLSMYRRYQNTLFCIIMIQYLDLFSFGN